MHQLELWGFIDRTSFFFPGGSYGLSPGMGGQQAGMYMNINGDSYQGGDNSVGANVQSQVGALSCLPSKFIFLSFLFAVLSIF